MRVFVTGATGLVGRALCAALRSRGDTVVALSRRRPEDWAPATDPPSPGGGALEILVGDPAVPGPWREQLAGCEAIVHLAGEPVATRRWTPELRERIHVSRVTSTEQLVAAAGLVTAGRRPRVIVAANGVDYYPFDESDRSYAEDAAPGEGFLADVCVAWQRAAERAAEHGLRWASVRSGLALARHADAFRRMALPYRLFVGGPLGSGHQWFSWIHLDDLVASYLFCLDRAEVEGPVNGVAPGAVRQAGFARALGAALGRPAWLPVPAAAARLALGPFAEHALHGRRVVPAALEAHGFRFAHPDVAEALTSCCGRR